MKINDYLTESKLNGVQLKKYLKEKGVDISLIKSLTCKICGYSEVISVWTKTPLESYNRNIKNLLKQFESIDYDEVTQEILSGGNTFVQVMSLWDCTKKAMDKIYPYVEEYCKLETELQTNNVIKFKNNFNLRLFKDGSDIYVCLLEGMLMVNRGHDLNSLCNSIVSRIDTDEFIKKIKVAIAKLKKIKDKNK